MFTIERNNRIGDTGADNLSNKILLHDSKLNLRLRKRQNLNHRQLLNPKYCRSVLRRYKLATQDSFWEYTRQTKLSGIWMLQQQQTRGMTRWIWSMILLALFVLSVYLSLQLWIKFYSYPILNTVSSDLAVTDVAFPGVTICSPNVVKRGRVRKFVKELDIPDYYNMEEVIAGFDFLNAFTEQNWQQPGHNAYRVTDEILRLNNISVYDAAMSVSAGCEDFVKRCFWGTAEFPCRQDHEYLSFIPTTSYLGPCCSFNYNPKNASYVPFSANIFGMDGGLSFIGLEGSEQNISTGLIILVHHPMDFVTEVASSVTITTNSESFVEILPTVHSSALEVLELSQRKRDCLISDDLQLRSYRQAACMLACETDTIYKTCNCYPYHLPTVQKDYRECKLEDSECYSQNYDSFKSVRCDQCLPNCYDVTYSTNAYKTDLQQHNYSVNSLHTRNNFSEKPFIVRIYLTKQVVPSIRKVTVMSWIGLLSDLGGVFNLCLGLSVISLIEICYFCTYRVYLNYKIRGDMFEQHKFNQNH